MSILLIYIPFIALSAREVDGSLPTHKALADTAGLKRLYDLVLQNMDTPSEMLYLDSLEEMVVKEGNIKYQGLVLRSKVRYYYNKTNFDSATFYADVAIPFFKKNNLREYLTDVESMIVNLYTWRNEYELALIKGYEMYDESERIGDKKGMIAACENIGFALVNSCREKDALEWYRKSLILQKGMEGMEINRIQMELLMADCFLKLDQVDSVEVHLNVMQGLLTEFEANRDQLHASRIRVVEYWVWLYAHLAEVSVREGAYGKAQSYLEKAGEYVSQGVEAMSMEVYYWAYSNYYQATGEYDRALEAENNSFKNAFTYGDDTPEQLYRFAVIYDKKGDARQAVSLYQKGLALSDSVSHSLFSSQISQFNSIYEVNELTEEIKHQRLAIGHLSLILIALVAFTLLLCLFVFIFYRYKKRLSKATLEAKEADMKTTVFLDNVSREIRLALDAIAELSRQLIKVEEGKEKKYYSELVRSKNETLQRVIVNILDVSKIESGWMVLDTMNIYLPDLMNEIKGWAGRFSVPGRSFELTAAPGLYLKSDITRLRQVLENLLYFFIIRSSRGDIVMECHQAGQSVEFNVSCAELLLDDKERELLFDRQVQAGKCLEDMGLELVICKELVAKMGGVLSISDKKEAGTSFMFTLPVKIN